MNITCKITDGYDNWGLNPIRIIQIGSETGYSVWILNLVTFQLLSTYTDVYHAAGMMMGDQWTVFKTETSGQRL